MKEIVLLVLRDGERKHTIPFSKNAYLLHINSLIDFGPIDEKDYGSVAAISPSHGDKLYLHIECDCCRNGDAHGSYEVIQCGEMLIDEDELPELKTSPRNGELPKCLEAHQCVLIKTGAVPENVTPLTVSPYPVLDTKN